MVTWYGAGGDSVERYLQEVWPTVTRALKEHGIGCELNLVRAAFQYALGVVVCSE